MQNSNDMNDLDKRLSRAFNPDILRARAYQAQTQPVRVKLDAMENPYNLLQAQSYGAELDSELAVNLYPDPNAAELKSQLREILAIAPEQGLILGNGSDELILNLVLLCDAAKGVLAFNPSFVMYQQAARIAAKAFAAVDLRAQDFAIDLAKTIATMRQQRPALIFIAVPNNPTGNAFSLDAIEAICAEAEGIVVIDQAYRAFSSVNCERWAREFEHVLMLGTFSKMGLAALRLGFAYGHANIVEQLEKVRMPYNISSANQLLAAKLLQQYPTMLANCQLVCEQRERLMRELCKRWQCFPSEANFITMRCQMPTADAVHQHLLEQSIAVKNLHGSNPLLDNCLRVSVGSAKQNEALLAALARL